MNGPVERDERTVIVEKGGNSVAYLFMAFAVLIDVAYRSFVRDESSYDLLTIVVLSGLVSAVYQARHKTLNSRWFKTVILAAAISVFIAALLITLK